MLLRSLPLLIALSLPSYGHARTFVFDFASGPSRAVSPDAVLAAWFEGQPINARIVLDLPSIANLSYAASFAHGQLFGESGGVLIGAKLLGISARDPDNQFGSLSVTTNARGRLTGIFLALAQDTPDAAVTLHKASWGDASGPWFAANGRWTLSDDPAPIPVPATAPLFAAAALPLAGLRIRARRRRRTMARDPGPASHLGHGHPAEATGDLSA